MTYRDHLEVDGAFSVTHINYGESPIFNETDAKTIAEKSRENSMSSIGRVENVLECIHTFNGTEKDYSKDDQVTLWKYYWFEYINAFDKLIGILPDSIVTINTGRHAIELGLKFILFRKTGKINYEHDLGSLSESLFREFTIKEQYMEFVDVFCKDYRKYIEGGNDEYFRYPEYKNNTYFAGNRLNIKWLSYNFAAIILKLLHFAELESEFQNKT